MYGLYIIPALLPIFGGLVLLCVNHFGSAGKDFGKKKSLGRSEERRVGKECRL